MNILIASAGRRVSLVKSFIDQTKKLNLNIKVFCSDLNPELSPACKYSGNYFKVKKITEKGAVEEFIELCLKHNIVLVIPTIDTELPILSYNIEKFNKNKIKVLISDFEKIKVCRDKRKTHDLFDSIKLPRAKEYLNETIPNFPVFIKPKDGSSSIGAFKISKREDLKKEIFSNKNNMILEYIDHDLYSEYTIDLYYNKNSKLICMVPRERIEVRSGEVSKGCTRKKLVNLLKNKFNKINGFYGCITLQIFKHKKLNKIYGIEINPRFGGGYPLSYLSGANFTKWILMEYILNENIDAFFNDWTDNLLMLRYDDEILINNYED